MSEAEELLDTLSEEDVATYAANSDTEEHIVIDTKRDITVPKTLKRIAVQFDHNIETVTFDCPRYWDDNDLSTMYIYINYMTAANVKGKYLVKNVRVDDIDDSIIHFEWTISKDVTLAKGSIKFLVCAMKTDEDGNEELHWNTEINKDMIISEGLESGEVVNKTYPDIINDLLFRMDNIIAIDAFVLDTSLTQSGLAADAKVTR